jgi:hypothetical protein
VGDSMTIREAQRDLDHASRRLALNDPAALDDAIRYTVRALGALFDARAGPTPKELGEFTDLLNVDATSGEV